jgi:hypothetical protein
LRRLIFFFCGGSPCETFASSNRFFRSRLQSIKCP